MNSARTLLSLASGVLPEFSPLQMARAAVDGGWPAVGIWVDMTTWTPAIATQIRAVTGDAGIRILDVEVIWLQPGADDPDHFRIVDAGVSIGAENVLVVSSDPDPQSTAFKLARLAQHASLGGINISLEFAAFTEVRSLAAAQGILETPGCERVGLLIDPLHLARTGGTPADLAKIDPARFHYAQFCDAAATGPAAQDVPAIVDEALDRRFLIGAGGLPLSELSTVLPAGLPLSIELRSKALRDSYPDPTERARALLQSTQAGLAHINESKAF